MQKVSGDANDRRMFIMILLKNETTFFRMASRTQNNSNLLFYDRTPFIIYTIVYYDNRDGGFQMALRTRNNSNSIKNYVKKREGESIYLHT